MFILLFVRSFLINTLILIKLSPIKQRPTFQFNSYDKKYQVDRTSVVIYQIENGIPLNPLGRTGLI